LVGLPDLGRVREQPDPGRADRREGQRLVYAQGLRTDARGEDENGGEGEATLNRFQWSYSACRGVIGAAHQVVDDVLPEVAYMKANNAGKAVEKPRIYLWFLARCVSRIRGP